ncbi:MAG: LLM class flavin-dependent oxidoreductase [Acidimicrobiaceae bacterium]|nr:LLM class flavin-dependent oxidoreductase [Acidimicrobiaceae bacterium]
MRTSVQVTADAGPWPELVDFVAGAEALGVDAVWVAEAWGSEAASPLGYLAARTERVTLGASVFQVGARSAIMTAQTAMTLNEMSQGRFVLGLGVSGPQVMEGLHGVGFADPVGRMAETLEVITQAFAGERIAYEGRHLRLPLPGGEGKSLRLSIRPETVPPIYLASMLPKMLELTGERADGWLGTSFIPEGAGDAYFRHLRAGAARAGRTLGDIDICQGAEVAFARDQSELAAMIDARRPGLAFSLGGMGSGRSNFFNSAYSRQGFADVAAESQRLWLAGDRQGAAAVIPDEMVLATTLIGTVEMVRDRLAVWAAAGVDTVRLYPAGDTVDERLDTLGRALDLVP